MAVVEVGGAEVVGVAGGGEAVLGKMAVGQGAEAAGGAVEMAAVAVAVELAMAVVAVAGAKVAVIAVDLPT